MCYIIPPEEIKEKERIIKPFKKNGCELKDDAPEYIVKIAKEIRDFYYRETYGLM